MPNKLLVEGSDDLFLCKNLAKYHNIPETFDVLDKKGIDNILRTMRAEILGAGEGRVGIVVDADLDINARWEQLRGRLTQCGYTNVPEHPVQNGLILEDPAQILARVGVWIMPDNMLPGMLEDFVGYLIPPGDTLWPHAEKSLNEIQPDWRFPAQHFVKARLHTWLAWQEEPGRPIGTAIAAKYLDPSAPEASAFVDWLNRLFNS